MNFINKGLFKLTLYKSKRDCDLYALDTVLRQAPDADSEQERNLKEDSPISIIAADFVDNTIELSKRRVCAYLRDEGKRGICNVTSIKEEGPYKDMDGKEITYFIAIPVQRMVTSVDTTGIDIMKATIIKSNASFFTWAPNDVDVEESASTYDKLLVLIANVKADGKPHELTISEATIGKQLAKKILDNPDEKSTFHQRTVHITIEPTTDMTARGIIYEGCNDANVYPCTSKLEKKTLTNKVLTRVATNIVKNARVADIIRSK